MSGHSKWYDIQGGKNTQDAKRGKAFQKLSRKIYIVVKTGDPGPPMSPTLRLVVDKAKAADIPDGSVERAIKKATSAVDETNYDEITYEGHGPGGVGVLVHALTDNRNRITTNVRVAFAQNGGSLGKTGSVGYLLDRKGCIVIKHDGLAVDGETVFENVLEAGVESLRTSPEVFEVYTTPEGFAAIQDELEKEFTLTQAELTMIPQATVNLSEEQREQLERLVDRLGDGDDISEVFTAAEI